MSHEAAEKWACQICTYENWPKSIKCTLCCTPKPSHLISDSTEASKYIYKMTPLITNSTPSTNEVSSLPHTPTAQNPLNKWACSSCTYFNWPRADRCIQCHASKPQSVATATSDPDLSQQQHQENNNDRNNRSSSTIPGWPSSCHKWSCISCTYENWPKSTKCVLCYTPRPGTRQAHHQQQHSETEGLSPPGANSSHRNKGLPTTTEIQVADGTSCSPPSNNNYLEEQRLRHLRRKAAAMRETVDLAWLEACMAVVRGESEPVIRFLSLGGDPARQLNPAEVSLLGRPSAFDIGHTLVHLAIRFQRHDLLQLLLSSPNNAIAKRVPSDVGADLAAEIRRHISSTLRQRKGDFPCYIVSEFVTFSLPSEIEDFAPSVQQRLFDELLDKDVQKELEEEAPIINWSLELTDRLGSRLYALWNRSAGDCLLDSALQATWGVFDRDNTLRRALGDSLCEGAPVLYPRWKDAETLQADLLHFSLDEAQWQEDWATLLSLATQPGSALEQMHIFTLAHILRRPIIVYGVKYVKSFRGEALGYARFEGIYLPLLWESSFCWKSPIALGYTRGHFSALVPMEPGGAAASEVAGAPRALDVIFLPLMTADHHLLPIHFLTQNEIGHEEEIMRQWLDCCVTEGGILVAQQKIPKRPLLVAQMVEEWLELYRHSPLSITVPPESCSSGPDSDQE